MLRGTLATDWQNYISKVAEDYNNTPLKKIGWLKPNDIKTVFDSALVKAKKNENHINTYHEPNFIQQNENVKEYETTTDIKPGDFVYLDFGENIFAKSFDVQVN